MRLSVFLLILLLAISQLEAEQQPVVNPTVQNQQPSGGNQGQPRPGTSEPQPASEQSNQAGRQQPATGKPRKGQFRKLTEDDFILAKFQGLDGWELDDHGVIRITDEKAYRESLKRRENKRKQELLRDTNTTSGSTNTEPRHQFNLFSWETPCAIIFIIILYWISSSILRLRDAFRNHKKQE